MTDHRINLTLYRLDEVMEGKLDMLIEPIVQEYRRPAGGIVRAGIMDFQSWLRATGALPDSESPKRDAEILLEYVTGKARTYLLAFGETELTVEQEAQLAALLARRKTGEPVAHLVGEREFWSLPLFVSAATLIPRPDTECLVEQALARLPAVASRILDPERALAQSRWRSPPSGPIAR